jgi:predicted nucleic acid-binding protein
MAFVLDSSVTLSWFFDDEATAATDELLDQLNRDGQAIVAAHWALEVGNTLLMAERRKRSTVADSSHFLALLDSLPIEADPETLSRANAATLNLARSQGLTLYDSAYLELAMRRSLPLATLDKALRAAAEKCGVACLPETF